jgi:hypothetical protein
MNHRSFNIDPNDAKLDLKKTATNFTSPPSVAATLLSDSLFPPRKPKSNTTTSSTNNSNDSDLDQDSDSSDSSTDSKKDPLATSVWRLYTKAKDTLPNGSRLENLTWRMMAMTLKKKEAAEKAKLEQQQQGQAVKMELDEHPTLSPPIPDDTTTMLSSSAPPYSGPTPPEAQVNKNVLVYGSARASSPSLSPSSKPVHEPSSNYQCDVRPESKTEERRGMSS